MYGPGGGGGGGGGGRERQFTPKGQMSSSAISRPPLSDLPLNLKMMFEPKPPLEFKSPMEKRESKPYTGIGHLVGLFEAGPPPERPHFEPPVTRKKRRREEIDRLNSEKNDLLVQSWDPSNNPNATENAFHTLFVGRLSHDVNEKKLRRELEHYGPIKTVKLVTDKEGKSRGYAFVEFEKEEDLTMAYKRADGKKVEGRRIVVDVERGRTVRNWRPRRFGGGLGGRKAVKSKKELEAEKQRAASTSAAPAGSSGNGSLQSTRSGPPPSAAPADSRYGPGAVSSDRPGDRDRRGMDRQNGDRHGGERDRFGGGETGRRRSRSRDRSSRPHGEKEFDRQGVAPPPPPMGDRGGSRGGLGYRDRGGDSYRGEGHRGPDYRR